MDDNQTREKVKKIKQSFRLFMNGITSASMRDKGMEYKINWGIPLTQLREIAKKYGHDKNLATALWQSEVRECKILATMIAPPESIDLSTAKEWAEGICSQELAEVSAFNLFSKICEGKTIAIEWLDTDKNLLKICAYHTLSRIMSKGDFDNQNVINEYLHHIKEDILSDNHGLRKAAINSLLRFSMTSEQNNKTAEDMCKAVNLDIL